MTSSRPIASASSTRSFELMLSMILAVLNWACYDFHLLGDLTTSEWLTFALSTVAILLSARVVAPTALKQHNEYPGIANLILASLTLWVHSLIALILWGYATLTPYAPLPLIFAHGVVLYFSWRHTVAENRLHDIENRLPKTAMRRGPTQYEQVEAASLAINDEVLVAAGTLIPADAVIELGTTSIDECALSARAKPLLKGKGDCVFAGTLNRDSDIVVRITSPLHSSVMYQLLHQLKTQNETAGHSSSPVQVFSQSISYVGFLLAAVASVWTVMTVPDDSTLVAARSAFLLSAFASTGLFAGFHLRRSDRLASFF